MTIFEETRQMMKRDRMFASMSGFIARGNSVKITDRYGNELTATITDNNGTLNATMPDTSMMSQVVSGRPIKIEERINEVQTSFSETKNVFVMRVIEKLYSWSDWQGYLNQ